jgi:hypothetical protein
VELPSRATVRLPELPGRAGELVDLPVGGVGGGGLGLEGGREVRGRGRGGGRRIAESLGRGGACRRGPRRGALLVGEVLGGGGEGRGRVLRETETTLELVDRDPEPCGRRLEGRRARLGGFDLAAPVGEKADGFLERGADLLEGDRGELGRVDEEREAPGGEVRDLARVFLDKGRELRDALAEVPVFRDREADPLEQVAE